MAQKFVRVSKYRHVFSSPEKKDHCYANVNASTHGEGDHIKANKQFFCVASTGGGGPVMVHKNSDRGRFGVGHPTVNVHRNKVIDFDWHPFLDTLLATGSEDCRAKVTVIPDEGLTEHVTVEAVSLEGHEQKVTHLHFHPCASNILATAAFDKTIKVWDIEKQAEVNNCLIDDFVYSFEWNTDGKLLAATCKDKKWRVFDPRTPEEIQCFDSLSGVKVSRAFWARDGWLGCVGFSQKAIRQVGLWDPRKPSKPINLLDIDQSAGVLMPHYDNYNDILYVTGKGDAGIKYFEVTSEPPHIFQISEFRSTTPQKGVCFLPKEVVDTSVCEVARALRLNRDWIEIVSFRVPRKSDIFQKDLYPDFYAGQPSMTAEEWISGINKPPVLKAMTPAVGQTCRSQTVLNTIKPAGLPSTHKPRESPRPPEPKKVQPKVEPKEEPKENEEKEKFVPMHKKIEILESRVEQLTKLLKENNIDVPL